MILQPDIPTSQREQSLIISSLFCSLFKGKKAKKEVLPVSTRPEERHGQIEKAPVGRRVRHVGAEVVGGSVDLGIGGHVGHGGEEVVHHARIVGVVDDRSVESRLQNVGEKEGSAEGHVMQMQERGSVREDRIDVDFFDVG